MRTRKMAETTPMIAVWSCVSWCECEYKVTGCKSVCVLAVNNE